MTRLSVTTRTLPCGPLIEVASELDHHTAPQTRDILPALPLQEGQQLLLDLGGLEFCDSTGITVMLAARNHAPAANATIALTARA